MIKLFFFSPRKAIVPMPGAWCAPLAMSDAQISLGLLLGSVPICHLEI